MLRVFDGTEAELFVEPVGIVRDQHPAPHFSKVGVLHNGLHQPLAETMGAVVFVDEDVAEISEDRVIADDARDADLFGAVIDAEDERVPDGAFRAFPRACIQSSRALARKPARR